MRVSLLCQLVRSRYIWGIIVLSLLSSSPKSYGQSTEEQFQDLFMTAGYASAFGATLGAAALSFKTHPEYHLRYIAIGASLGFIGGSILGSYLVFSPVFTYTENKSLPVFDLSRKRLARAIYIHPTINPKVGSMEGLATSLTLATF